MTPEPDLRVAPDETWPLPPIVDRETWQADIDALRAREKAHTREGDAISSARRRLPMVEVESMTPLIGRDGPITTNLPVGHRNGR